MLPLCLVLLRPPRACSHISKFYCSCVSIKSPQASQRPQASPASSKTSQSHRSLVGISSASRGPGVPFTEIPFHPEKALSLGNLLFGDLEARGVSQPMEIHGANKETQDPQRAPRTPGVRSQALHLCANGAGLGIIRAPNYVQLSGLFVQRDQGDFWLPSHLSSAELSEAEGKRVSHCLLGNTGGGLGRGRP